MVLRADCAQRTQVEMGVAELQRVERPAHGRAPVGEAPVPLFVLQRDAEAGASIVGIDRQVVRVQHVRLVRREAVHRAHETVAVERADRHPAFADRGDQHVDGDQVAAAPHARFERRHRCELCRGAQLTELDASPAHDLHRLGDRLEERPIEGDTDARRPAAPA